MSETVLAVDEGSRAQLPGPWPQAIKPVLEVEGLEVGFPGSGSAHGVQAVRGLGFRVLPGQVLGLVGESGSGKTLSCLAVLGLLPGNAIRRGRISLGGEPLSSLEEKDLAALRGRRAAIVFQEPRKHLDPSMRIGAQMEEILRHNLGSSRREARARTHDLLASVGLEPRRVAASWPHELSGGMCQRVSIAMAVSCGPELLVADEPTTALDASVQRSILDILRVTVDKGAMGMILVTHDLRAVSYAADEVAVMLGGLIVEQGPCKEIISFPLHPYTRILMDCLPSADFRSRRAGRAETPPPGPACPLSGRCPREIPSCSLELPALMALEGGRKLRCPVVLPR